MSRKKVPKRQKNEKKFLYIDQAAEIKALRGFKNVKYFAQSLGIPLRTYYRYESGERKMPDGLLRLARILYGEQKKSLYKKNDKGINIKDYSRAYLIQKNSDLLNMAAEILNSSYADALAANIRAFFNAIQDKKDITDLKKRVNSLEKKGHVGSVKVGSGSPTPTGDATRKKES